MADPVTAPLAEIQSAGGSLPSPTAGVTPPATDQAVQTLDLMQRIVTHPAFPAAVSAFLCYNIIEVLKARRDKAGKPAMNPALVRIVAFVLTLAAFIALWSLTLKFSNGAWGPYDFAYGLIGGAAPIAWFHWSPWRERESADPNPPTTPG